MKMESPDPLSETIVPQVSWVGLSGVRYGMVDKRFSGHSGQPEILFNLNNGKKKL